MLIVVLCLLVCLVQGVRSECNYTGEVYADTGGSYSQGDFHVVALTNLETVISWTLVDADGETVTGFVPGQDPSIAQIVYPADCFSTTYRVYVDYDCDGDGTADARYETSLTMEPTPINMMADFSKTNYDVLRSQKVNIGDTVTMTCQSEEEVESLYAGAFTPLYTWFKATDFEGSALVQASSETGRTIVIDSASCEDAGYYYCKIRRCPNHSEETKACNNNNLVVQTAVPEKTHRTCRAFGDPHISTFDGSMFTYKGRCWYVLAMDAVSYRWFVYGWFSACGDKSTCLESVSVMVRDSVDNTVGTQVQLLRGFGVNIASTKHFIARGESKQLQGMELSFHGDKLTAVLTDHQVVVEWDGVACVTVKVPLGLPTYGLCGDNNGDSSNDFSTFYDGVERSSDEFADAWSVGQNCLLSYDAPSTEIQPITTLAELMAMSRGGGFGAMPESFVRQFCQETLTGFSNQAADTQLEFVVEQSDTEHISSLLEACLLDIKLTGSQFFDTRFNFQGCMSAKMLADEAEEKGLCISRWDISARCPSPIAWREEAIRIGCIWSEEDANIVRS